MRIAGISTLSAIIIASCLGAAGSTSAAPYEGKWAGTQRACRDPDSPNRLLIQGTVLQWYETRCVVQSKDRKRGNRWMLRVSCRGEGQSFRATPRLSLEDPDHLVIEQSPVEPVKRQSYRRCRTR